MNSPEVFQILLVEDDVADALMVREALRLQQIQCELHSLSDGARAIEFIGEVDGGTAERRIDLVLLDFHLPKRNGSQVLERLRSTNRFTRTPVIVLTGGSPLLPARAMPDEHVRYFHKPMDLSGYLKLGLMISEILLHPDATRRDNS